ncbi:Cytochrome oxidase Cu insertion factor, SCO1/SenC/PrrC family [Pseudomonas abietaniphila]|uniref:Cytochrome oxidase Cu insertion factor, SCO1/SenC/PrrC family n=2 Tax=Pseudomonas abietaniphila TaxID=89065 RepID=A0A1G7T2R7_9PSED|nr:Cytochrome oxidase Cu insertion factor, SCO1/SenC/PrrC family [Pseudomonas abietaniphila]
MSGIPFDAARRSTRGWLIGLALMSAVPALMAHEAHETPTLAKVSPVQVAPPSSGTHDAQEYFTDTPLKDQDGNTVRFYSDELKNRLVLLNVVFTHCQDACPLITRKLKDVRAAMGDEVARQVYFITLTSDPTNDTPDVLKAFAVKHGVDGPNWRFLTGTQEQMNLVLRRLGQVIPSPEQHSTQLIVGDVANKRWAKIRPDAPVDAIAQRLQFLTLPVAGR